MSSEVSATHRVRGTQVVRVTASRTNIEFPEFDGILYKARNNPRPDELVLTSDELALTDVTGGAIYVEHNRRNIRGRVGTIVGSEFRDPDYYITGRIDTDNLEAREEVRDQLRSGKLGSLSIGIEADQCDKTGKFLSKRFNEASLVEAPFYENCSLVRVEASADNADSVQTRVIPSNSPEIMNILQQTSAPEKSVQNHSENTMSSTENTQQSPAESATGQQEQQENTATREPIEVAEEDPVVPDEPNTNGKTQGETENAWKQYLTERDNKASTEIENLRAQLAQSKKAEQELAQIKQLEKQKYAEQNKPIVEKLSKRIDQAELPAELKEQMKMMGSNPEYSNMTKFFETLIRDTDAKDANIESLRKDVRALKRRASNVNNMPAAKQTISVASSGGNKRPQIPTVGGNSGMRPLSFLDLARNKNNGVVSSNNGKASRFGNQSYGSPALAANANTRQIAIGNKQSGDNVVPEPQREQYDQQWASDEDQVYSGDVRPIHQKVFANCSMPVLQQMAQKEHMSRHIYPDSIREQGEHGLNLFEDLWMMDGSGCSVTVGDEMSPFFGKDLAQSQNWMNEHNKWANSQMM